MSDQTPQKLFRQRFLAREPLIGTFIKTPTIHATEILGLLGFDFIVVDEEHSPFDRGSIDTVMFAARAMGVAGFVRVAAPTAPNMLSVLDCGATGVLVPHCYSEAKAREIVSSCRYRGGKRGFSSSPRAALYGGSKMWEHIDSQDAQTTVIAMIEDAEALDEIDAIANVEGLDGFFIGRSDLTVALGVASQDTPELRGAVEKIAAAAIRANKIVCAMVAKVSEAEWLRSLGVTALIVASDQGFMRQAAAQAVAEYRKITAQK